MTTTFTAHTEQKTDNRGDYLALGRRPQPFRVLAVEINPGFSRRPRRD